MNAHPDHHLPHPDLRPAAAVRGEKWLAALLRWRFGAQGSAQIAAGSLVGALACGFRDAALGADYRLTYVLFFPFVALAGLLGRPIMGAAAVAVTVVYVRTVLIYHAEPTPLAHLAIYSLSAATVIALCEALTRTLSWAGAERRRARAVEGFYASLVRSSNDAIVTKTLQGIITGWNPAAVRLLGYEAHEVIGRRIDMLFPPDRAAEEQAVVERIVHGEAIEHFLTVRQAKSGARLDVSLTISPIYDENGFVVGASKILRDVTKAKQTADALRESEERLRCALQGAKAGTWRWDVLTQTSDWSPRFSEMHGLDPETATASFDLWLERIFPDDREAATVALRAALAGGRGDYHGQYRIRSDSQAERWVEIFGLIERQPDGSPRRISGISLDVTERHVVLDQLKQSNDNLRRANESLNKFSSIAAHDLQEPLRKLEQFGDMLQQDYTDLIDGDGAFYLRVMRDSAQRMRALINALLDFSRAGNRTLTREPIDMNEVMRRVQGACERGIEETGARIEFGELPTLYGDAALVTQLFQNLVSNAIKYSKPGAAPFINIAAEESGPTVSIHVRDEGVGIAPEHHELIFQAFTRLNPRETIKGAGIGLAFCRTVCERHDWRLTVASEPDRGSVFSIAAARYRGSLAA